MPEQLTQKIDQPKIAYAEPVSVSKFEGSEIAEASHLWEKYRGVAQGEGRLVSGGKVYSDGFSDCVAFTLKDPQTKLGGLFHISDIDFETSHQKLLKEFFLGWLDTVRVSPEEKEKLAKAISDVCCYDYPETMKREDIAPRLRELGIGRICTQAFSGDSGRYLVGNRLRESMFDFLGVTLPQTKIFKDYRHCWSILADFDNDTVKIGVNKDEVLEYPM